MPFEYDASSYNTKSAEEVVPLVMDLLSSKTIVDVGCGIGTWLSVFKKHGAVEVVGIDNSDIAAENLHISPNEYLKHDLTKPIFLDRKFDLVVSLEVAEHVPECFADEFVRTLVNLGDTILLSAAIPGQGGQNHLNEQWLGYWQKKFSKHGFHFHDAIRQKIWHNPNVEWWYRQNLYLVTSKIAMPCPVENNIDAIHPEMMRYHMNGLNLQLTRTEKVLNDNVEGIIGVKQSMVILRKAIARKLFYND